MVALRNVLKAWILLLGALAAFGLIGYAIGGFRLAWVFSFATLLGGLTTFSTFSAEVVQLMTRGEFGSAIALAGAHLAGSLLLTAAGFATFRALAT